MILIINIQVKVRVMMVNATFNNISLILWVLLMEETAGVPRENHSPAASH